MELCCGLTTGMDCQFREDTLGVVTGGVSADVQVLGNRSVRLAPRQQPRDVQLPTGESVAAPEIVGPARRSDNSYPITSLSPELAPQFPHLVNGASQLTDKIPAILAER